MKMDGILSGNTIQVKFRGPLRRRPVESGRRRRADLGSAGARAADAAESSGGPGGYVPLFIDGKGVAGWGAWGKQGSLSLAEMRRI